MSDPRSSPKRIIIAWFITSLDVGGTERQLVALCGGLPDTEFEKHIICLSGLGPLEADARAAGAQLYDLGYPRRGQNNENKLTRLPGVLMALPRLLNLLRRIKPDILHTLIPICNIIGAAAGRIAGVPALASSKVALGLHRLKNPWLARFENWSDRRFDLVHCKSNGILEQVATHEPIPRAKMRVIYNGLRLDRFERQAIPGNIRSELQIPDDAILISTIANLIPYKGHREIVAAARTVIARFPKACFLFVGRDDGIGEELKRQAAALGIEQHLVFAGERKDIPSILAASNMMVSASHEEGFSNVLLEGMAAKLPIVATRVGGNPEAVVDEETGLLVEAKAPDQLASAIARIAGDPDLAALMGTAGQRRVQERFSYEAMIAGMRAFYAELLEMKKRR